VARAASRRPVTLGAVEVIGVSHVTREPDAIAA
jgi:hypothetical protein